MSLSTFLSDLIEITTSLTTMFTDVMSVFMEPPLSIIVALMILAAMFTAWGVYYRGSKTAGFFGFK